VEAQSFKKSKQKDRAYKIGVFVLHLSTFAPQNRIRETWLFLEKHLRQTRKKPRETSTLSKII